MSPRSTSSPFQLVTPANRRPLVFLDDERSYVELMTLLLGDNLDCPVHPFTRPADALAALSELQPAVVVTDYFMPEIDGIEFIKRATALAPGCVFIMITGHNLDSYEDQLARLGALKSRLDKPFSWRRLAEEILRVWPDPASVPSSRASVPTT